MLNFNTKAPDFSALDQDEKQHQLSDYKGKWLLLYFYPRDNTPGCTKEACALRDKFPDFGKLMASVIGVSTDSVASHEKFAKKFELPFTILADTNKEIVKAYEANGLARRISYLINPDGFITKIYPKVKPEEHAAEVLKDLEDFIAVQ